MNRNQAKMGFSEGFLTLQTMFPGLDDDIILAVLEQTSKNIIFK